MGDNQHPTTTPKTYSLKPLYRTNSIVSSPFSGSGRTSSKLSSDEFFITKRINALLRLGKLRNCRVCRRRSRYCRLQSHFTTKRTPIQDPHSFRNGHLRAALLFASVMNPVFPETTSGYVNVAVSAYAVIHRRPLSFILLDAPKFRKDSGILLGWLRFIVRAGSDRRFLLRRSMERLSS